MSVKESVIRGPKECSVKTRVFARTMTTGTLVATVPKGSRIVEFVLSGIASNAVTTATLSIGSTVAATEFVNGHDVKTAATGAGTVLINGVPGAIGINVLTVDTPIYFKYAETGGASTLGSWVVHIKYTTGNILDNDTI
jgi:hypothetical protein